MKLSIPIILLIVLNTFIVNAQIDDVKSFIDNGNFEIADGWGSIGDLSDPTGYCYFNKFIKYWYGCGTPDVYSKEVPDTSFFYFTYGIPILDNYPYSYNPNTWDKDIINKYYVRMAFATYSGHSGGEHISQKFKQELTITKKYIYECYVLIKENIPEYHFKKTKLLVYLDSFRPDLSQSFPNTFIGTHLTKKQQIIYNEVIPQNKWVHIKSKPFSVKDTSLQFLTIGGDPRNLPIVYEKDKIMHYDAYLDNVIFREASVGLTSFLDNQFPCPDDTVTFRFKLWKDYPEFSDTLTVIDSLPQGLTYLSGDFRYKDGKLLSVVYPEDFGGSDSLNLYLKALTNPDAFEYDTLLNKVYFEGVAPENRGAFGKYRNVLFPGRKTVSVEKKIELPVCRNKPVKITIDIKNLIDKTNILTVYETNKGTLKILDSTVTIDGTRRFKGMKEGQYVNLDSAELNFYNLRLDKKSMIHGNSVRIEYEAKIISENDSIYSITEARPESYGCAVFNEIYEKIASDGVIIDLPEDTASCKPVILSVNPNYSQYIWSTGEYTNEIYVDKSGKYYVDVFDDFGCMNTDSVDVFIEPKRQVQLSPDSLTGEPGDKINCSLILDSAGRGIHRERTFHCILSIDKEMLSLFSTSNNAKLIDKSGDREYYELTGKFTEDDTTENTILNEFKFTIESAGRLRTQIRIDTFYLDDCTDKNSTAESELFIGNSLSGAERYDSLTNEVTLYNFPNPFEETTTVIFEVTQKSHVKLYLSDVMGNRIKNIIEGEATPGAYKLTLREKNISSGVYLLHLIAKDYYHTVVRVRKILCIK